ncbi:MAG: hypothetical protein FP826_12345 [Sphingomonadales bacterium]|nr:hypothetical protein [Sphingomonadales bacterium]
MGVFNRTFTLFATKRGKPDQLMIDVTHLTGRRAAASLRQKGGCTLRYRRHRRRPELQATCSLR